jgi:imidazole glycerol phosphate synthase subunit HisF
VSFAVSGGGVQNYYAAESELESSKKVSINADSFMIPRTVEDLQANFNSLDLSRLDVRFE